MIQNDWKLDEFIMDDEKWNMNPVTRLLNVALIAAMWLKIIKNFPHQLVACETVLSEILSHLQ